MGWFLLSIQRMIRYSVRHTNYSRIYMLQLGKNSEHQRIELFIFFLKDCNNTVGVACLLARLIGGAQSLHVMKC